MMAYINEEDIKMIFFLPTIVLLICGWLIKYKKITWLISGYNTASKEQKQRYDTEKLCHYVGNFLFILAGILFSMAVIIVFIGEYSDKIILIGFGVLAIAIVCGLIYLNTGNRVKKKE